MPPLELWGGHECTVNRVDDRFHDQTMRAGHDVRADDLARFAGLGIRRLRYPVLWENVSPDRPDMRDFTRSDERLGLIRDLGMSPIVGLIHHGSGPAYTDLLSADFASGLAAHALATARRYPWVTDWTPVNEPLTTARFAALYGHWYPHARDETLFWRAFLNQIDAVRLSMAAIRSVIPDARLVQTEDLGFTYATDALEGQAAFGNLRRWATWDVLSGHLDAGHPLWPGIAAAGLADRLYAIADAPCPPDIIGINHYLTSDRFLDHRVALYPERCHGMSGDGMIADVEAIRAVTPVPSGLAGALRDSWHRYQRPIAVTEVHNGCTREEQMRWVLEAWQTAQALRGEGIDVRAVTAWSLLGAFDWNSLLTRNDNAYECGVFDVRVDPPRETAVAPLLRELAAGTPPTHPVLGQAGWWRRDSRLLHPPHAIDGPRHVPAPASRSRPILITGATGTLGRAFATACELRNIPYLLTDRARMSLDKPASIARLLDEVRPWAVVNTAGWVRVDEAELHPDQCLSVNRDGSVALGQACTERGIRYATFSSDLVFDGLNDLSYVETDKSAPLNVYGRSKAEADDALLALGGPILIVRTAAFFSQHDRHNFAVHVLENLRARRPFAAATDCAMSPTYVPDLVRNTLDLVIDGATGIWHLVNNGSATWYEFGRLIARASALDPALIEGLPAGAMGWRAVRPARVPMRSLNGSIMPDLDHAIHRFSAGMNP